MSTLPKAFEECDDGECPAAKPPKKNKDKDSSTVEMENKPQRTCTEPCMCLLFSADKGDAEGKQDWDWESEPDNVFKAAKKQFRWICVKPVFDGDETLCATGSCHRPVEAGGTIRCKATDSCAGTCKCVLFRWEEGKRKQKWKRVTPLPHKPEAGYVYRCFCVS